MTIQDLAVLETKAIDAEFGEGLAEEIADCRSAIALVQLKELIEQKLLEIGSDWLDCIDTSGNEPD